MSMLYKTLFAGTEEKLSESQEELMKEFTAKAEAKTAKMSEEEKIAAFNKIMGR